MVNRNYNLFGLVIAFFCVSAANGASSSLDASMFPQADSGYRRILIQLKPLSNEENAKIELIVSKTEKVDCNVHMLGGELSEKNLEGWGYSYYVFRPSPNLSTLMACPKPPAERVIKAQGFLTRYNSRLPVVAYIPDGYNFNYRIWRPGPLATP